MPAVRPSAMLDSVEQCSSLSELCILLAHVATYASFFFSRNPSYVEESDVNECVGWSQQFSTLIAVCEKAAELSVRQPMPYIMVLLSVVLF